MHIALIGAGNTATVLGRMMKQAGHEITGVYSKTLTNARLLADELNAQYAAAIENITQHAEIYIIAVPDDVIYEIAGKVSLPGKIAVHTSGSTPKTILSAISEGYGVLYPLQSLRKETQHQPIVPLLIDGNTIAVKQHIKTLAESISPLVEEVDDGQRLKLHLAAVMASNFSNYLYTLTADFCMKEGVPFKTLVPLIQEVATRTASYQPIDMQTGPAVRGDMHTIEKHLQLLAPYPLQKGIYEMISESIISFYSNKDR